MTFPHFCISVKFLWHFLSIVCLATIMTNIVLILTENNACFAAVVAFFAKMDTSAGLSSIASLSLGFTMSMRSGDNRMGLPLARSLVSLSGQRQQQPTHSFHHPADTPMSALRHPRPRKASSVYSSVSGRSPVVSTRPFSESRSTEKIAEEGSRDRHVLLHLPSSTSMQSLTVDGSSCHFQKIFPNGVNVTSDEDPTEPPAPGPLCNAARAVDSHGERPSSVGINDICIVISDASAADGRQTRASSSSDQLRRSSLTDSVDEIGRTVKFFVGTPVNTSVENITNQAATSAMDSDPLSSPSSSQVLNGPAPRAPQSAGEPMPRRGQSAKFAAKWLSKLRNSVRRKSLNNGCSVVSSLETDARKSVFVLSSASAKNGRNKVGLVRTFRLVNIIYLTGLELLMLRV